MTVEKVIVTNGRIIGVVIDDNGTEKRAKLVDLEKLLAHNKISYGAKLIDGRAVIDAAVLKRKAIQSVVALDSLIKDDAGIVVGVLLKDDKRIDMKTAWSLAADDRLNGLQAAYMKDIGDKVIIVAS